ncbi:MAG: hypothetical protein HKN04_09575, partial [Rhodothermaceae bacterium]|nr:hypothetical protein [Rhodothermaceae bacterium]
MNARLARRFLGVAALLALLVPLTLGVEAWQVERVRAGKDTRAAAVVADAQQTLQARTTAVMADLHAEAERLARDPA